MVRSRTATAIAGVVASLLLSLLAWWYFETVLLFLFVPFVPILFQRLGSGEEEEVNRPATRECPVCGYRTRNAEYDYCPRDGTELE